MTTPAQAVRLAVERCHRAIAAARLQRWRDPGDDAAPGCAEDLAWLASERGAEALAESLDTGELDADSHVWLARHVRALTREFALGGARRTLRADLGAAVLPGGEPLHLAGELGALGLSDDPTRRSETARMLVRAFDAPARALVDAHLARERMHAPKPALDFGGLWSPGSTAPVSESPPRDDRVVLAARAFLRDTADAAEDSVRWHVRGLGAASPVPWHALVRGLRARDLDAPSRARERFRHAAGALRRLGFEGDMNARMRAEVDRGSALPFAGLACLHAPRDVRVGQSPGEWGVLADVCAADGVGRALGVTLALPTLPVELRWPLGAGVPGAMGALVAALWADRVHLARVQGLTRPAAERVARVAGAFVLLRARFHAAVALAPEVDTPTASARVQALAALASDALRCDVPPALAGLCAADLDVARDRAEEHLSALALAVGLRGRYDEDWFLNRRVEDPIRGAGQRGNALSLEAWCKELGVSLGAASSRGAELVA